MKSVLCQEVKRNLELIPDRANLWSRFRNCFQFFGLLQKSPNEKAKLQTFEELFKHLWTTFVQQSTNYQRIDIAFDIYLESSRQHKERKRRGKDEVIETIRKMFLDVPFHPLVIFKAPRAMDVIRKKSEQQAVPIHDLVSQFDGSVIEVLPSVRDLTGMWFVYNL